MVGLALRGRAPRTDMRRAAYLMWGGWLVLTALVFSLMAGIVHTYYAVVLAPAIGALVGGGAVELWSLRKATGTRGRVAVIVLAASVAGSALLAALLLDRTPDFYPWLAPAIVAIGLLAAALLLLPQRRLAIAGATLALAALLVGPGAYALDTINSAHSGGDPQAGPATSELAGFRPGDGQPGAFPGDGRPGGFRPGGRPGTNPDGGIGPAGPGAGSVDDSLISYLQAHHASETWLVAVTSSSEAAPLQLATGVPVMAIGGFSGGDDALTVAQLQAYVESGQLRYIMLGGERMGGPNGDSSELTTWVTAHGTPVSGVGSGTLYDLRPSG